MSLSKNITLHTLVAILFLTAFTILPYQGKAEGDTSPEQAVTAYYDAIIKQNFGIAAELYLLPEIGSGSPYSQYQSITNASAYFEYLYPTNNYSLTEYEILVFEEIEENRFHANVRLKGVGPDNPDGFEFYQDVLVTLDLENNWKVSMEAYIEHRVNASTSKPIEELSERELIFRLFNEIDNGNYGVAADITSPKMSTLENTSHNAIAAYLKKWNSTRQEDSDRITAGRLHILNEIPLSSEKNLFLVSADPNRNDKRLNSNSLFGYCSACTSASYMFVQLDKIDGETYINLTDGNKSFTDALSSDGKKELDAEQENISKFIEKATTGFLILGAIVILLVLGFFVLNVSRFDSFSPSVQSRTMPRTNNSPPAVDIEASVDQLLAASSAEDAEPVKENKLPTLKKSNSNKTRRIHTSSEDNPMDSTNFVPTDTGRKIHTDDD